MPPGATVAIAVCDGTRPQPRRPMLSAILEVVAARTDLSNVVVLVATGHPPGQHAGRADDMFGPELLESVRIVNHDARDPATLVDLGTMGDGVPVQLNRDGSTLMYGSPPGSSNRTSLPGSRAGQSWSLPGWRASRRRSPCTTPGASPALLRPGACSKATRSTTTYGPSQGHRGPLRLRRGAQSPPRGSGRLRRRTVRHAPRRHRRGAER